MDLDGWNKFLIGLAVIQGLAGVFGLVTAPFLLKSGWVQLVLAGCFFFRVYICECSTLERNVVGAFTFHRCSGCPNHFFRVSLS